MILEAVLIAISIAIAPGNQSAPQSTAGSPVALVRQHLATLEVSAQQAKAKSDGDPKVLADLQKQYVATSTAVDQWRNAAMAAGEQVRIEELAKTASRAIVNFGRDARTYVSGRRTSVDARAMPLIEQRLIDAARTLSQSDEQVRQRLAPNLTCRPWEEIR